jgi:multiple sugar transport system permease protein
MPAVALPAGDSATTAKLKSISSQNNLFRSRRAQLSLFLTPYLLGALLLVALPAGISFFIAFTRYNGIAAPSFAGWQNFQNLRLEPLFKVALINSLLFILQSVPLRVLGALTLALLLNRPRRGTGLYRAAIVLPTVIPDVAYALTWTWILNPLYGPLNASLRTLGLFAPPWLSDSAWSLPGILLASLFPIGEGFILLLAGLRHIPREVEDAARVDGANGWQMFTSITLPLLAPWLALLTIRDVVLSFQNTFTPAAIMTRGGPYYSTFFTTQLIYETAFDRMDFGLASVIMLMVFLVTILLVMLVYFLFEGGGFDEE